jgi:hypothetical protein
VAVRFGLVISLLLIVVSLVGCSDRAVHPSTRLTILAINASVGRAAFHLDCGPSGGDVGNAARACSAVTTHPELLTDPKPFTCAGGTFSWWDITITGWLNEHPIRTHTSTCWTPQMAMIDRLGIGWKSLQAHLLPRRREAVLPGIQRIFPPGLLQPGDLVNCRSWATSSKTASRLSSEHPAPATEARTRLPSS